MKLNEINAEATHTLKLSRAEAFELLQELSKELADETQQEIELLIFED